MKTNIEEADQHPNFSDRCVASCRKLLAQIADVKENIVSEFRGRVQEHQHVLELALNEAEALAWQTDFPQLLFPTLALEKASAVTGWHYRQQALHRRTAPALMAA
jgi:hypothetical protein